VVYSTLRADQIDLRRTRAVGARHLKLFLEYAERGPKAIAQATASNPDATFDSPFEQRVHDLLCAEGWEVELQVGCSGYRIDLAIRDRDNPGRYLAGVECDGAYYHSAKTARDRDRLRQAVLESLGWTLLRIWSTDFWLEPEIVIGRIHAQLTRLQEAARRSEKTLVGANAPVNGALVADDAGEPRPDGAGAIASVAPRAATRFQTQGSKPPPRSSEPLARRTVPPPVPPAALQGPANEQTAYRLAKLPAFLGSDEAFYEAQFSRAIAKCIATVLQVEAPIHRRLLVRRVIGPFCLERATARVNDRVNEVLRSMHVRIEDDFVMPAELEIEKWRGFRVPSDDPDAARKSDEIHVAELANAAIHVLERNMGMERAELAREIALVFGVRRVTPSIGSDMDRAIQYLLSNGRAREQGGQVVLS
jgi:very-short-patch-repair endonuclease